MKLDIVDAVMCKWHKRLINLKACKGKGTMKPCPHLQHTVKSKHLSPKLIEMYEEVTCSYGEDK